MTTTRATIAVACCVALAGCDGPDPSSATAPTIREPVTARAATGARASGHADLSPFPNFEEKYSFVALGTGLAPAGKGQMESHITSGTTTADVHVEVDCVVVVGNEAWASGLTKKFVVNGVDQSPIHVVWRVRDNGEGAGSPPDEASLLAGSTAQGCRARPPLTLFPSNNGNIQVVPG